MSFLKLFKQQDRPILCLWEKSPTKALTRLLLLRLGHGHLLYNLSLKPVGMLTTNVQQNWCLMSLHSSEAGSQTTWYSTSLTSWLMTLCCVLLLLQKMVRAVELMFPWTGESSRPAAQRDQYWMKWFWSTSPLSSSLHQEEHTIWKRACFLVGGVGLLKIGVRPGRVLFLLWAETK